VPWLNFAVNALSEMKVQTSQDNQLTSIGNSVTTCPPDTESVSASKYPVLSRLVYKSSLARAKLWVQAGAVPSKHRGPKRRQQ
jgi:hypothetical protein